MSNEAPNITWERKKLKDCILQLNTGLNPRDNFSLGKGTIKYITAKNLTREGYIDFSSCDYVDHEAKEIIHRRSDLQQGDILFSSRAPIGPCHYVKEEPTFYDIGESIFCIRVNKDIILPQYLCLYFTSNYFINLASKNVTGSVIKELRIGNLLNTDIIVPPMSVQEKIANCIGNIDDKLENNKAICYDLEAMAKLLYDYWFVQFDFPDENGKPYKSSGGKMVWNEELKREIPEGWNNGYVSDLIDVGQGKDHQKLEAGDIPVYGSGGFMRGVNKFLHEGESVLIPRKGTLNNIMIVDGTFWTVDTMFYTMPRIPHAMRYLYYTLTTFYNFERMNVGSGVPSMTSDIIRGLKLVIPSTFILKRFDEITDPWYAKIKELKAENQELTSLRNFLLPMLMNGQMKVW